MSEPVPVTRLEDFTLEMMADEFVHYTVPHSASVEQKHDMKVAFIAGVATVEAYQRRIERETPERIRSLLAMRKAELEELCARYSFDARRQ